MTKYVARGTVYHEYTVEIEAESADEAREIAESMLLDDWSNDGVSGMDIYEVYEEDDNA